MRPYLITAKLMRASNMKRFPTPALTTTHGSLYTQKDKINNNIELLQSYPGVGSESLLEIGRP
jgi:hypothetical protein